MDNFYRRRYGVNPVSDDLKLDACTVCVLHTSASASSSGWPSLVDLVMGVDRAVGLLHSGVSCLCKDLDALDAGVEF